VRQRDRETQTVKETETYRHRDREKERKREREKERHRKTETERQRDREIYRQRYRETKRQKDKVFYLSSLIADDKVVNRTIFIIPHEQVEPDRKVGQIDRQ
jgi:hypothetical protein